MKTINIIGAGNVGHYFSSAFYDAGYEIKCIYNRTIGNAKTLAEKCGSMAINDLIALPNSDLNIIAISDDYVAQIGIEIERIFGASISLVHTSGSLSLDIFPPEMKNVGCIWPLQSISKGNTYSAVDVPLCIDANTDSFLSLLKVICTDISSKVEYIPSEKKRHAHLAAVISNNFTIHLLTLAEQFCKDHSIDFNLLKPLIIQSVNKIKTQSPKDLQTGPARRMDMQIINDHLELIDNPHLKKIYRDTTKSIINTYHENH
ncbi:MAG: DUF2520 domain-containing protein [Saprospiraceae bacterium]